MLGNSPSVNIQRNMFFFSFECFEKPVLTIFQVIDLHFALLNQNVEQLNETYDNIVGDVLLSAGVVAYLGTFILDYRQVRRLNWDILRK